MIEILGFCALYNDGIIVVSENGGMGTTKYIFLLPNNILFLLQEDWRIFHFNSSYLHFILHNKMIYFWNIDLEWESCYR